MSLSPSALSPLGHFRFVAEVVKLSVRPCYVELTRRLLFACSLTEVN